MAMTFRTGTLLLPFGNNPLALPIKKGFCEMFNVRQFEPKKKSIKQNFPYEGRARSHARGAGKKHTASERLCEIQNAKIKMTKSYHKILID